MPQHKSLRFCICTCASPTLSCEQITCLFQSNLHDFRVARATERSDFDYFDHLVVQFPKLGPFFSRSFTNRNATRATRNFLTRVFPISCNIDFTGTAHTPCRKSLFEENFSEVTLSSAWVSTNVLASTTEFFRFFGSHPAFTACLNVHLLPSLQFRVDERNTQVDASNHRHFLLDNHPLEKRSILAGFSVLDFSVGFPLSTKIILGQLDGREPFPFPLDSRLCFWIVYHSTLISWRAVNFLLCIARNPPLFLFPVPWFLPLAAATPDSGFPSCPS